MALRLKANRRFPSIPIVTDDPKNHTQVLMAIKEAMEIGQRRTTDLLNSYIRVQDLVDLGLIDFEGNTTAIVGADLSQIANIGDLTGAAEGDFLRFEGGQWINDQLTLTDITQAMVTQHQAALSIDWSQIVNEPTIPSELGDLTDVDLSSAPDTHDVLTWDGSDWVAAPIPPGGAIYLDDILDVDAPYPNVGDVLTWDGYGWVNDTPSGGAGVGVLYAPPLAAEFPDAYSGDANNLSLTDDADVGLIVTSTLNAAGNIQRLRMKSLPSAGAEDWTVTAALRWSWPGTTPGSFNLSAYESNTGKVIHIGWLSGSALHSWRGNNLSSFTANIGSPFNRSLTHFYLRISYSHASATYSMQYSGDGKTWIVMGTVAATTAFTVRADKVGFGFQSASNNGSNAGMTVQYWDQSF